LFNQTRGRGEPLLLLHGGFGTVEDFSNQTLELSKQLRVAAFERPGHGHTADNNEPFHFATMTQYAIDFIQELGIGPTNLLGWRDGAIVALLLPISRPDLVKRLVCVGGSLNPNSVPAQDQDWIRSGTPSPSEKANRIW